MLKREAMLERKRGSWRNIKDKSAGAGVWDVIPDALNIKSFNKGQFIAAVKGKKKRKVLALSVSILLFKAGHAAGASAGVSAARRRLAQKWDALIPADPLHHRPLGHQCLQTSSIINTHTQERDHYHYLILISSSFHLRFPARPDLEEVKL